MSHTIRLSILASAALLSVTLPAGVQAQQANMSFFVTSTGSGKGADLGGVAGADQRCQQLAQAAGSTGKTWHAYLSTQAANGQPAINARDRIGNGPWQNANAPEARNGLEWRGRLKHPGWPLRRLPLSPAKIPFVGSSVGCPAFQNLFANSKSPGWWRSGSAGPCSQ